MGSINKLSKTPPTPTLPATSSGCFTFGCGGRSKKKSNSTKDKGLSPIHIKPSPPSIRVVIPDEAVNEPVARTPAKLTRSAASSTSLNKVAVPSEASATLRLGSALTTITERTEPESIEHEFERPTLVQAPTLTSLPVIDEESITIFPQEARRHSGIPDFRPLEENNELEPSAFEYRRYSLPIVPSYRLPLRTQPSFASSFEGFDAFFSPDHQKRPADDGNSSKKGEEEENEGETQDYNGNEAHEIGEDKNINYHHNSYDSKLGPNASMNGHPGLTAKGTHPNIITIVRRRSGPPYVFPSTSPSVSTSGPSSTTAAIVAAPSLSTPSVPMTSLSSSSEVLKTLANLPDIGNSVRTNATATRITANGSSLDLNKPLPTTPSPSPAAKNTWRSRLSSIFLKSRTNLAGGLTQSVRGSESILGGLRSASRSVESLKESAGSGESVKGPPTWKSLHWARAPAASVVSDCPPILPILDSTEFTDLLHAATVIISSRPATPMGAEIAQDEGAAASQSQELSTPQMAMKIPITPNSNRLIRSPGCKDLRVISTNSSVVSVVFKGPTKRTLSWVSTVIPGGDHIEDGKTTPESKAPTTSSNSIGNAIPEVVESEAELKPAQPTEEQQVEGDEGERKDVVDDKSPCSTRRGGFRGNYKEFMDESLERYGRSGSGGTMTRELSVTDSVRYIVGDRSSRVDPRKERMLEIWGDVKAGETTVIV